jgi:NADPH:quinone reductase-like Zn-dependent oxidoreductase
MGALVYLVGALEGNLDISCSIIPLVRTGASITGFSIYNHHRIAGHFLRAKAFITNALEKGEMKPVIDRVFDFADTLDAYAYMKSGVQRGKIVVRVGA